MVQVAMQIVGLFGSADAGRWAFLSIGAVCLFAIFLPINEWLENRRKEREAFYRADTLRRLAEASGESARAALEVLRVDERRRVVAKREGIKLGGLILMGIGVGLTLMFLSIGGKDIPYLVGAIPGMMGLAMLAYVYFLAAPIE